MFLSLISLTAFADLSKYHCNEADLTQVARNSHDEPGRDTNILLMTGGGSKGAWGAGFINGWREDHEIPVDMITGVSSAAVAATFVYLDDTEGLKDLYLKTTTRDFYRKKFFLFAIFSDSLYSTRVQKKYLKKHILTEEVLKKVAEKSKDTQAPVLCVGTTNINTGKFVMWDLAQIAGDGKFSLYRDVVQASIAFPILFPPVKIDGQHYVDGGLKHNIFVNLRHLGLLHIIALKTDDPKNKLEKVPKDLLKKFSVTSVEDFINNDDDAWKKEQIGYTTEILSLIHYKPNAYFVINDNPEIAEEDIRLKLVPLTMRTASIMMKMGTTGSLYKIYYDLNNEKSPLRADWQYHYTKTLPEFDSTNGCPPLNSQCKNFMKFERECTESLYCHAFKEGEKNAWFNKFPDF